MNRLLVLAASVLLAVLVVGLAVAQEKEEPKYYIHITTRCFLADDKTETTMKTALDSAVVSSGFDAKQARWSPASKSGARALRLETEKKYPQTKRPDRGNVEQTIYSVIPENPVLIADAYKLHTAMVIVSANPAYHKSVVSFLISPEPLVATQKK
jgi:hypothetical protein